MSDRNSSVIALLRPLIIFAAVFALARDLPAVETLVITPVPSGHAVEGGRLRLSFALEEDGEAVPSAPIYVDSDNGAPSARTLLTDADGLAILDIHSLGTGRGELTAHTRKGTGARYSFDIRAASEPTVIIQPSRNVITPGQAAEVEIRSLLLAGGALRPSMAEVAVTRRSDDVWSGLNCQPVGLDDDGLGRISLVPRAGEDRIVLFTPPPDDCDIRNLHTSVREAAVVQVINPGSPTLTFLEPTSASNIETDSAHFIEVRLHAGDVGIQGWPIRVDFPAGSVLQGPTVTDGAGITRFSIMSGSPGPSRLLVTAGSASRELDLQFVPPPPERNQHLITYGVEDEPRPVGLNILPDEISFLPKVDAGTDELQAIIARSGLKLKRVIGDGIHVLTSSGPVSRDTQWKLARELAWRNSEYVLSAGLPARLEGTTQELMIGQTIILLFEPPGLDSGQLTDALAALPYRFLEPEAIHFWPHAFKLRLHPESAGGPVKAANDISKLGLAGLVFAQPNFLWDVDLRSEQNDPTADPDYPKQWHHRNTAQHPGGLPDADADTFEAWEFTQGLDPSGAPSIIAVVDSGFDISHPDLKANLLLPGNSPYGLNASCFQQTLAHAISSKHGTRSAGVAAARGGNGEGGSGSCPLCKLLLFRYWDEDNPDSGSLTFAESIKMATECGATVISNSWGWPADVDEPVMYAIDDAVANDVVVVMAMSNEYRDNCGDSAEMRDTASRESAIAVSGVSADDTRAITANNARGFGDCMDLLAPTKGDGLHRGLHTTDVDLLYEPDFDGTSAATPLVAGIVALMRSVVPDLSPLEVQRTLQDTADRVEPHNASYDAESGFDNPPKEEKSKHAFGRVNAYEAVRLVAPQVASTGSSPGKGNKDLFLRDHELDWGNTEQDSDVLFTCCPRKTAELQSVDIKFEVEPADTSDDKITAKEFSELETGAPESNKENRIYVRLRNRGHEPVGNARLNLYWAPYKDELPSLPDDFWKESPGSSDWTLIDSRALSDIEYSGPSIAGCPDRDVPACLPTADPPTDKARVFVFESSEIKWKKKKQRVAFIAVVDSDDDPVLARQSPASQGGMPGVFSTRENVVKDNNVTLWTSPEPEESDNSLLIGGALLGLLLLLVLI